MNLSERLDAARRKRDLGFAPDLGERAYVLRGRVEGHTYDGRELRTGEVMDPERWEELQAARRGMELPKLYGIEDEEEAAPPVSLLLDLTGDEPLVAPDGPPAEAHLDEDAVAAD